jgi:hypothetical protein
VPDDVYDARRVIDTLPVGWAAEPYGLPSGGLGKDWAASSSTALLDVPPSSFQTNGMCSSIRSMRTRRVARWWEKPCRHGGSQLNAQAGSAGPQPLPCSPVPTDSWWRAWRRHLPESARRYRRRPCSPRRQTPLLVPQARTATAWRSADEKSPKIGHQLYGLSQLGEVSSFPTGATLRYHL